MAIGFIYSACLHSSHPSKKDPLRRALYEMRNAIDKYTMDKERAPQTLQDLVTTGYLKKIPEDPMTQSTATWQVEIESESASSGVPVGIYNVRSGAKGGDRNGTPFDQY